MTGPPAPIDYTNVDYDALREGMLSHAESILPEWSDRSANDLGMLLVEMVAYAADITQYYQTRIANNLLPGTSDEPEPLIQLLRLIGYELRRPSPASADLSIRFSAIDTVPAALPITIPARTRFTATLANGTDVVFESMRETTIQNADLEPPDAQNLRLYRRPLVVVEGQTEALEAVGVADGRPNQQFALQNSPVLDGSIEVFIDEAAGTTEWHEVQTLAGATSADRVFTVQRAADGTATLVFGDGASGMIPPLGTALVPTRIRSTYRYGGGTIGNVPTNTQFVSSLPVVKKAENAGGPAGGGTDLESLERARLVAPNFYRTQNRAVTRADYTDLVDEVGGVGKVLAVAASWNNVILYVAPAGAVAEPTDLLKRQIHAYLESRRMATTNLIIRGPIAADIYIGATVTAEPHFLQADVKAAVVSAVESYLDFDSVQFGQVIYLSQLYDRIQSLEQVASLTINHFGRDPDPASLVVASGMIELRPNELPRPGFRDNPDTPPDPAEPGNRPAITLVINGGIGT